MSQKQKNEYNLRLVFLFICFNLVLTIFIFRSYLSGFGASQNFGNWFFVHLACVSDVCMLYLILGSLILLLARIFRRPLRSGIFSILILFVFQVLVFIDTSIYRLFHFHINGIVINLLTTEGASDSLHLGSSTYISFIGVVALILALQILAWAGLGLWLNSSYSPRFSLKKVLTFVLIASFLTIVTDKIVYAVGDLYNNVSITSYVKVFPLYQPFTIKRFVQKRLGFQVDRENMTPVQCSQGIFKYPRQEPEFKKAAKLPNILWIAIDSWRFDMLNAQVSPNLYKFSQRCLDFKNHYSGGNCTRFGIFSMFYGMYSMYWHNFLGERRGPVLVDALLKLNYKIRILSSTRLTYPELRKTAFVKIPEDIDDHLPGHGAAERDPRLVQHFLSWLDDTREANRPFFSFLFLDGPHGPYSYPAEFTRFKPAASRVNYLKVGKKGSRLPLYNRYRNAVFFDDQVLGGLIKSLDNRGLLNSTVIVITGDHGEEFNEAGFWGHNSAFTEQQTHVSFLMYVPGRTPAKIYRLTSHLDLVTTMLELMGTTTEASQYSQGRSLLEAVNSPFVVCSSWNDFALIDSEYKIVMPYNRVGRAEVRDRNYHLINDQSQVLKSKGKYLLDFMKRHRSFLN